MGRFAGLSEVVDGAERCELSGAAQPAIPISGGRRRPRLERQHGFHLFLFLHPSMVGPPAVRDHGERGTRLISQFAHVDTCGVRFPRR